MSAFDDDNYDDGFDDEALAARMDLSLWRQLFGYAAAYPRTLAGLGCFAVLTALAEVSYPLITKAVVDQVSATGVDATLWPWMLAYLGVTLVAGVSIGGFIWLGGKIRTHVSHDIRADGFRNLQKLSFDYYDYRPVGWLMARMTSDCERLSNIMAWGFLDLVWGTTMMIGIACAMLIMNAKLALVVLAILPVLGWISARFQRRILASARTVRATNSRITGSYNEAIMGVLTSKAFVREQANADDFGKLTGTMHGASVRNLVQAAIYVPIVVTLASLATGLALALGGSDLLGGLMTAGTLVAFMAYTSHFFEPVEELGAWFAEMQMAQASAERILSLINAEPSIKDSAAVEQLLVGVAQRQQDEPELDPRSSASAMTRAADGGDQRIDEIELRGVQFAYDPKEPVLRNIDLRVKRGETIAIVGPTGGGKSTLVNVICRFYEPTAGQVLINGLDYRARSLDWLHGNLGIVLQQPHVFSGSIAQNIRYGRLDASDSEIVEAARIAGADAFISALPEGYASEVGEGGSRLSAGQKQLVSFARAVLANPQIMVMDEATSSVDTETEQQIQRGIAAVLNNRISFIIAHRLSTVRNADRILVIADGAIVEAGDHAALIAARGRYFDLYRRQSASALTTQSGS